MKRFIEGQSRERVTLPPECLDDLVGADNPVRIVDAFVEELDLLSLGFDGSTPAATETSHGAFRSGLSVHRARVADVPAGAQLG